MSIYKFPAVYAFSHPACIIVHFVIGQAVVKELTKRSDHPVVSALSGKLLSNIKFVFLVFKSVLTGANDEKH